MTKSSRRLRRDADPWGRVPDHPANDGGRDRLGGLWEVVGERSGIHGLDERVLIEGFHGQVPIWEDMLRRVAGLTKAKGPPRFPATALAADRTRP